MPIHNGAVIFQTRDLGYPPPKNFTGLIKIVSKANLGVVLIETYTGVLADHPLL